MKVCPKCSTKNVDAADFCKTCGENLTDMAIVPEDARNIKKYPFLVESSEPVIAELGSNYIQGYLSNGYLETGFSVVTQKRVYFKGKCFNYENGKWVRRSEEKTVDLKDITGTGYLNVSNEGLKILGIILTVLGIFSYCIGVNGGPSDSQAIFLIVLIVIGIFGGVGSLIRYFLTRKSLFEVNFAGGKIAFDVKWYPESDTQDFQRQLRLAKDNSMEQGQQEIVSTYTQNPTSGHMVNSIADELKKCGELLSQGLITKEEYENIKKDILLEKKKELI